MPFIFLELHRHVGIRNYSSVSTTVTKGQDRLDRLEKMAEAMFARIAELKAFQAETDRQIRELKESQARTDEQMRRTNAKLDRIGPTCPMPSRFDLPFIWMARCYNLHPQSP